ncbi:MAG: hypothetical protein PHO83_07900 [Geobacteraceae bacterium]|nr:hypothetical protein [Geobacteraceae bacterium]
MEYRISVNHEERFMEVKTQGTAATEGFLSFISELLAPSYLDLQYNLLIEMSELDTSSLKSNDIRNIVGFLELHKEKLSPTRHAIVAATPLAFGFARMYQILADGALPMSIQVFALRDKAREWLRDAAAS